MRIAYCCLGDFRAPPGPRQILALARALRERGHESIILIEGDPATRTLVACGSNDVAIGRYEFKGPLLRRTVVEHVADFGPDLVHCYEPRTAPLRAALTLARKLDIPLCVRFADDDEAITREAGGKGWGARLGRGTLCVAGTVFPRLWPYKHPVWYRTMLARAAGYDAITDELARAISDRYAVPCRGILPAVPASATVPNGGRSDLLARLGLPRAAQLIVYTGSVYRPHFEDFSLLLRAFAQVAVAHPETHLVHTGRVAERYKGSVVDSLAGPGADRVHLLGFLEDPAEVESLLHAATVLVQPGVPNDFNRLRLPAKLHDYLQAGRPVITFATGFGALLDDQREAVLTRTAEPQELASKIEFLLADPARAAAIGAAGRRRALELFDPRRVTDQVLDYYEGALASAARA